MYYTFVWKESMYKIKNVGNQYLQSYKGSKIKISVALAFSWLGRFPWSHPHIWYIYVNLMKRWTQPHHSLAPPPSLSQATPKNFFFINFVYWGNFSEILMQGINTWLKMIRYVYFCLALKRLTFKLQDLKHEKSVTGEKTGLRLFLRQLEGYIHQTSHIDNTTHPLQGHTHKFLQRPLFQKVP